MTDPLNLTLAELAISPLNVRFNEKDANAVEALSASIVEQGLLEQLLVHPATEGAAWTQRAPGDDTTYKQRAPADFGIFAGGRRYRAIRLAVSRGQLPPNFPIRCEIRDLSKPEIITLSLSENLLRRDLQGYEVHKAIADLRSEGRTIDEIAQDLGQSREWVQQQARLGELADGIFEAYCDGQIDVEQARAFGATDDEELQIAAWEHFARKPDWERSPADIRRFYKIGDHQLKRLFLFVGEQAYREAGGAFELDLFAGEEQHRGRIVDEAVLQKLAEAKLQMARAAIKEQAGWRDLAFVAEPPQRAGYTDTALEISISETGDLTKAVPKGTPDNAIVVTLEISSNGALVTRYWWESRKAKNDAAKGRQEQPEPSKFETQPEVYEGTALGGFDQGARKIARDEHGLTADGLQICRSQRRDLLRAVLLRDAGLGGNLARDYLVCGLLRQMLADVRNDRTGLRHFANDYGSRDEEPRERVRPYLEEQLAGQYWKDAVEELLAYDFLDLDDDAAALEAFVKLGEDEKSSAAAVLTGLILVRSLNADGYRLPVHDKIAELAGADAKQLRRFWEPNHAWTGLLPKMKRLELAQPFVEAEAFRTWKNLTDKPLNAATAHVLSEQKGWLHPVLTFDFEGFEAAKANPVQEMEAAE